MNRFIPLERATVPACAIHHVAYVAMFPARLQRIVLQEDPLRAMWLVPKEIQILNMRYDLPPVAQRTVDGVTSTIIPTPSDAPAMVAGSPMWLVIENIDQCGHLFIAHLEVEDVSPQPVVSASVPELTHEHFQRHFDQPRFAKRIIPPTDFYTGSSPETEAAARLQKEQDQKKILHAELDRKLPPPHSAFLPSLGRPAPWSGGRRWTR